MNAKTRSSPCSNFEAAIDSISFDNTSPPNSEKSSSPPSPSPFRRSYRKHRSGKKYLRFIKFLSGANSLPSLFPERSPESVVKSENTSTKMPIETISKLISRVVPTFSGAYPEEINVFLDSCKQVCDAIPSNETALCISLLKTKLRGEAYNLLQNIEITSFNDFKKLLLNTYNPQRSINDFLSEMRACNQRIGEGITSYGTRLTRCYLDCKRAILQKYSQNNDALISEIEDEAKYIFKTGVLSPLIRNAIISKTDGTIEDLIALAREAEKTEERMQKTRTPFLTSTVNPPFHENNCYPLENRYLAHNAMHTQNIPGQIENDRLRLQVHSPPPRITFTPHAHTPSVRCSICQQFGHEHSQCRKRNQISKCFRCHNLGHSAQECNMRQVSYASSSTTAVERNKSRKKCMWCARWGHLLENCRARQAFLSQQQTSAQSSSPRRAEN